MERNDTLLLALGWEMRRHGSLGNLWRTKAEAEAGTPFAESKFTRPMRPYDNLQDAVDCVPEGWEWRVGPYWACLSENWLDPDSRDFEGRADTPAEALAEAIMKAVSHD